MLLYTPLPIDMIMEGYDSEINLEEITYKGVTMQAQPLDNKTYKIIRIISSNPYDYLRPELQPGNIIEASLKARET
jgi:hypothetical protein